MKKIVSLLIISVFLLSLCACKTQPTEDLTASSGTVDQSTNDTVTELAPEVEIAPADPQTNSQAQPKPQTEPQPDVQTAPDAPVSNTNDAAPDKTPETDSGTPQDGEMSTPSFIGFITYEEYNAMSAEKQHEYFNSFESVEKFFEWYNSAKSEYEKNNPSIEIGSDGSIDLGEITNGKK